MWLAGFGLHECCGASTLHTYRCNAGGIYVPANLGHSDLFKGRGAGRRATKEEFASLSEKHNEVLDPYYVYGQRS